MYGKIIGIMGKYGAGKDTVAGMICNYHPSLDFKITGFADGVRAAYTALTCEEIDDYSQEFKQRHNHFGMTNRELLERIGEGMRKLVGDDVWIKRLQSHIHDGGNYIITDVRYPNELEFLYRIGAKVFVVERPGNPAPQTDHPANTAIWKYIEDKNLMLPTLVNDGDLNDLTLKVIDFAYHVLNIEE